MDIPSAAELRSWSKLGFGELGYADDADLQRLIVRAGAALRRLTGRDLAVDVPDYEEPLFQQALQGLTEQLAFQTQQENLETLSDFDLIQSFSAGPYSETRRSPKEAFEARMLNAWPWLNSLLWSILSPDMLDYWEAFFGGSTPPAWSVSEVDWGAYEDIPYYGWGGGFPPPWGG
jgi:hypothetical protein